MLNWNMYCIPLLTHPVLHIRLTHPVSHTLYRTPFGKPHISMRKISGVNRFSFSKQFVISDEIKSTDDGNEWQDPKLLTPWIK
jgi:hypothetical protein